MRRRLHGLSIRFCAPQFFEDDVEFGEPPGACGLIRQWLAHFLGDLTQLFPLVAEGAQDCLDELSPNDARNEEISLSSASVFMRISTRMV